MNGLQVIESILGNEKKPVHAIKLKSLYISCTVSNFYGTEIEIWAGFRPVGSTKKNWPIMSNFFGVFFLKYCSVRRSCINWFIFLKKIVFHVHMKYPDKAQTFIARLASNFNGEETCEWCFTREHPLRSSWFLCLDETFR